MTNLEVGDLMLQPVVQIIAFIGADIIAGSDAHDVRHHPGKHFIAFRSLVTGILQRLVKLDQLFPQLFTFHGESSAWKLPISTSTGAHKPVPSPPRSEER